jgi:hypothetical protein
MTKPFRELAKLPFVVRDVGEHYVFHAADWTGWLHKHDDTLAAAETHTDKRIPRIGALIVMGVRASDALQLKWTHTKTHAEARMNDKIVILVDHDPEKQSWKFRLPGENGCVKEPSLAIAMFAGINLIQLENNKPKPRYRK